MSKDKLAKFVSLLTPVTGPELLGSVDPNLAALIVQATGTAQSAQWLGDVDPDQGAEILRRVSNSAR